MWYDYIMWYGYIVLSGQTKHKYKCESFIYHSWRSLEGKIIQKITLFSKFIYALKNRNVGTNIKHN